MRQLYTRWGKELDPEHVLEEYPRPHLARESYTNLNGYWDYAFTKTFCRPKGYEGKILVPFSPESVLSGVSRQLKPDEYLWYRRGFVLKNWEKRKSLHHLILHFGAVDQACIVYINGKKAVSHTGGYLPFETDISKYVQDGDNELIVAVKDLSDTSYHSRGKQKLERGGMFYTAQSGIWQTVWMEEVPKEYVCEIETVPDIDKGTIRIRVKAAGEDRADTSDERTDREKILPIEIQVKEPDIYENPMKMPISGVAEAQGCEERVHTAAEEQGCGEVLCTATGQAGEWIEIRIPDVRLWNCEEPWLYYFTVKMGEDRVESYFAMRKFSVEKDEKGIPRICLNGKVQFQSGVLDQGYWPDGLYTAPSDEAFIFDIEEMKKTGFNMVRKHIKIEPQRWYYHCDRLGIVVWQDMVNGGSTYKSWLVTYAATVLSWRGLHMKDSHTSLLSRKDKAGRLEFVREMKETIRILKMHPSIAVWVIFNEGWGQFQAEDMTKIAREADPYRLIDQASGWFDQGGGDLKSVHNYFFKLKVRPERNRAFVLSEIGGHTFIDEEHSACEKLYGYGAHKDKESLGDAYGELMRNVNALIPEGLCASVYTQWSDVEEEVNGVYTYDREVRKIREQKVPAEH